MVAPTKTASTNLFSLSTVATSGIAKGPLVSVEGKFGAMVFVRYGRISSASMAAPVFKIEASRSGTGNDWIPVHVWTTALHGNNGAQQTLSATAAAGATTIQLSGAVTSSLSAPVFIYNSAVPGASEWNELGGPQSTAQVLNWSLSAGQTAGVAILTSQAETWTIPLDLTGVRAVRFTVNTLWNAVATSFMVDANMTTWDTVA